MDALSHRRWVHHITGALTAPVLCEYVTFLEKLESIELRPLDTDQFDWRWTLDGTYSASSVYHSFFLGESSGRLQLLRELSSSFGLLFTVEFGRVTSERGMVSRIQQIVRSAAKKMRRSTTCYLLASMLGSFGSTFCIPLAGNASRRRQPWRCRFGGLTLDGRCLKTCGKDLTRWCYSCPGACGNSATLVSSITRRRQPL
jgi:hypothetical protein